MVEAEIASQPDCWRSAARLAPVVAPALPRPGEPVAVIGCGTSLYMARASRSRSRCGAALDPDRPRHLTRSVVLDPNSGYLLSR